MLEINKFNKIIVANWKLNGSFDFIDNYFLNLSQTFDNSLTCGIICPPFGYLSKCEEKIDNLFLGAQDCSSFEKGAFTGEISPNMLKDIGCEFCIIGHSERRKEFGEKNKNIKIKALNLIKNEIIPIICIGETISEKKAGKTEEVLKTQILQSVPENIEENSFILAYEPIWSIGSGITPNLNEIQEIHSFIKRYIDHYQNYKLIYGGSVNSKNVSEITSLSSVDGVLVGGASLEASEFAKILKA